jgi:hypothetical protein
MLLGAVGMILLIRWVTAWRLILTILFVVGLLLSAAGGVIVSWPLLGYLFGNGPDSSLFPPTVPDFYAFSAAGLGALTWTGLFTYCVSRGTSSSSRPSPS